MIITNSPDTPPESNGSREVDTIELGSCFLRLLRGDLRNLQLRITSYSRSSSCADAVLRLEVVLVVLVHDEVTRRVTVDSHALLAVMTPSQS